MKNILVIAGSDSVAGAGIQADLKTCVALDCYASTAITALVAENSQQVLSIFEAPADFVDAQIQAITNELEIDAIKLGILFNKPIMQVAKKWLKKLSVPVVFDPVCVSKSGVKLIEDSAIEALKEIFEYATIATPNRFEADLLFKDRLSPPCDIVVKKHIQDSDCVDILYKKDGSQTEFKTPLANPLIMHGAGCSFSAAIACFLARGESSENAIKKAKNYVYNAINSSLNTKFGSTILNHEVGYE